MADDQVGLDVGTLAERLVECMGLPDLVFKSSATVVSLRSRAALSPELDSFNPRHNSIGEFRQKRAAKTLILHQMSGNVAKLSREILMNEENMHRYRLSSLSENSRFEIGAEFSLGSIPGSGMVTTIR